MTTLSDHFIKFIKFLIIYINKHYRFIFWKHTQCVWWGIIYNNMNQILEKVENDKPV